MLQGVPSLMAARGTFVPVTLKTSLISYWKLDEASGTRVDSHGSNDLTDNNTVGSTTGIINNGAEFIAINGEWLSHVSNASLQVSSDFTITAWVKLTSQPGSTLFFSLVTKDDDAANSRDYALEYYNGGGDADSGFRFFQNVTAGGDVAKQGAMGSTGVWYFLVAWYDSSNGQVHLRIDDTTTYNSANTGQTTVASAAEFRMGQREYPGFPYYDGVIDEVGFWKRLLTSAEITQLYNGGAGLPYSSF